MVKTLLSLGVFFDEKEGERFLNSPPLSSSLLF